MTTVSDYVSGLPDADRLLDMVSASQEQRELKTSQREMLYPEVGS